MKALFKLSKKAPQVSHRKFLMLRVLPGCPESQEVIYNSVDGRYCQVVLILLYSVYIHWELQHFCLNRTWFQNLQRFEHTAPWPSVRYLHHFSSSPEQILGGRAKKPSQGWGFSGLVPSISSHLYYPVSPKELGSELHSFLIALPLSIFPNGIIKTAS